MVPAAALCLLAACSAKKEAAKPLPHDLEVVQCTLAANGEFVGVRFRVTGPGRYDPDGMEPYLIDEATGERYEVVRLQRIGRIAEFSTPGEKDLHHVMFRNREGKLRAGSYVTVVVGPARREHLQLRE